MRASSANWKPADGQMSLKISHSGKKILLDVGERDKDYILLEYSPLPESLDPVYPAAHGGPQGYPHQAADQSEGRHQGQVLGVDPEDKETEAEVLQSELTTKLRGISHCLKKTFSSLSQIYKYRVFL